MVYPQMSPLTQEEVQAHFAKAPVARLCSANEDGTIHVAPVWFNYKDGNILIGTQASTRKARNVKRNNNVTILIDSPEPPMKGAVIYGKAKLDYDNPIQQRASIFEKYLPKDRAQTLAQALASMWKLVILRIEPSRIVTWDYAKDPTGLLK